MLRAASKTPTRVLKYTTLYYQAVVFKTTIKVTVIPVNWILRVGGFQVEGYHKFRIECSIAGSFSILRFAPFVQ